VDTATLEPRAWQGLAAIAFWLALYLVPIPLWADPLVPLPSLVIAANTLGPRPWFARWGVAASRRRTLAFSAIVIGAGLGFAAWTLGSPGPTTDQPLTITCAARDLWHGADPYDTYEPQCLATLHSNLLAPTPLERGPFADATKYPSKSQLRQITTRDQLEGGHSGFPAYGYPPEAALLILPVAFSGWTGISLWVLALSTVLLAALWGRELRRMALLFAWNLAALVLLWVLFRWNPEDLSYLLLAIAFGRIDRPRVSSVALAAAVCSNPLSWPVVPVYLAILARDRDRTARWAWLAGGIAVGILPWLVWDHDLLAQVWNFLTLPEFPIGASLGALSRLPSHSHLIYEVGFFAGIGLCTYVAWRWPAWRWSMAALVYGSFVLSWRAPLYYFMPLLWLSPAITIGAWRLGRRTSASTPRLAGAAGRAIPTSVPEHS
jgi:hypothetical protein